MGNDGAPVVIQIHGGAWAIGNNRNQAVPLLSRLAEHGWVCVTPNYRLSPASTWPAHIVDIMKVIAWTKANIAGFGGDPSFIAITGGSAGGHLASLAGLAAGHPDFQPGFEHVDTTVQAVVPYYGAYDWLDRDGTANPNTQRFVADKVIKRPVGEARSEFEFGSPRTWVDEHAPPSRGRRRAISPSRMGRACEIGLS